MLQNLCGDQRVSECDTGQTDRLGNWKRLLQCHITTRRNKTDGRTKLRRSQNSALPLHSSPQQTIGVWVDTIYLRYGASKHTLRVHCLAQSMEKPDEATTSYSYNYSPINISSSTEPEQMIMTPFPKDIQSSRHQLQYEQFKFGYVQRITDWWVRQSGRVIVHTMLYLLPMFSMCLVNPQHSRCCLSINGLYSLFWYLPKRIIR